MHKILIVDDEKSVRDAVRMILEYEHFATAEAASGFEALTALEQDPSLSAVLCDVKMPGKNGLDTLAEIKTKELDLPIIMISGHGTLETAVEATRRGAYDFLEKPLDRDRLLLTLRNALGQQDLRENNRALRQEIASRFCLVGTDPVMQSLRETIERVAPSDARVLISGENGTGKELVARNLHVLSKRSSGPWVAVNCAAIPAQLMESELFGHEKGAFTGAGSRKMGKFELAHGGTLFLDEVGDLPLEAQAKMLRVLQENRVQRVGGDKEVVVDVRVIAATNKDLELETKEGRFREDLFYRLCVIPIKVPPLRDRGQDVLFLFQTFLSQFSKKYGRPAPQLGEGVATHLCSQPWPGNVRQVRNLAERVCLLLQGEQIEISDLRQMGTRVEGGSEVEAIFSLQSFEAFKQTAEKLYLLRQLDNNGWNIKRTAETLGMQRSNLYKKIERYGLKEHQS